MATAGWETVLLGDVLERVSRPTTLEPNIEYSSLGVRWYAAGVFKKASQLGTKIAAKTLYRVEPGDVVYSRLFAWKGSFGIAASEHAGCFFSNEFPTYRTTSRLLPEFFAVWSAQPAVWALAEALSSGTTANSRFRLSEESFLSLEIDLPPLEAQRAIVDAVNAADYAFVAVDEERNTGFRALRVAIDALIAPAGTFDDLPEGWELRMLGEIADVRSGITKGRKTIEPLEAVPFLRAANVQDGYLDLAEIKTIEVTAAEKLRFRLEPGDVLMVEGGNAEHLGRGWIWNDEVEGCLHQNHVFRARPNKEVVDPRFLAYIIGSSPARVYCLDKAKKTTNLASINKTQISALPVALPPLDTQNKIAASLDALRDAAVRADRVSARLKDLRASLIDSLLSDERRVRDSNPVEELTTA